VIGGNPVTYHAYNDEQLKVAQSFLKQQHKVASEIIRTYLPESLGETLAYLSKVTERVTGVTKGKDYLPLEFPAEWSEPVADNIMSQVRIVLIRLMKIAAWCRQLDGDQVLIDSGLFPNLAEKPEPDEKK